MELDMIEDIQTIVHRELFPGTKTWQYICFAVSILLSGIVMALLYGKVDATTNGMIAMGVMILPGILAFYNKHGLDLFEIMRQKRYMKVYVYEKTEKTERGILYHGRMEDL